MKQDTIQPFTLKMRHLIYLVILIVVLPGVLIMWRCHRIATVYDYLVNDSQSGSFELVKSTELPDYITSVMGSYSYGLSGVKEVTVTGFPDYDLLVLLRLKLNCRKYHLQSTVISPQSAKLLADSSSLEELIIEYLAEYPTIEFAGAPLPEEPAPGFAGAPLPGELSREAISQLTQSKSIVFLEIHSAYLPDDILQMCANMKQLRRLDLTGSEFKQTDFSVLADLPHLEELAFDGAEFTDQDLKKIGQLQHLKRLSIGITPFSDEAIEKFREQNPNCQIRRDNTLQHPWD